MKIVRFTIMVFIFFGLSCSNKTKNSISKEETKVQQDQDTIPQQNQTLLNEVEDVKTDKAEKPNELLEKSNAAISEERRNGDWLLYVDDAYNVSKETGKPIMANFTGSDWCGWCIRLKNEVFKTPAFKTWAAENVVLLELDFPRKTPMPDDLRAQNSSLQQAFRVSGYPTIWVFNLDFNEDTKEFSIAALGKTGYVAGGPSAWIAETNKILKNQ